MCGCVVCLSTSRVGRSGVFPSIRCQISVLTSLCAAARKVRRQTVDRCNIRLPKRERQNATQLLSCSTRSQHCRTFVFLLVRKMATLHVLSRVIYNRPAYRVDTLDRNETKVDFHFNILVVHPIIKQRPISSMIFTVLVDSVAELGGE